ncbi:MULTISPECIES: helix-turn-helix transcriptional regulator [Micrococcales]|uniref:Helix-turn-helix transcriptional regulator n=1 Tax=Janibacter indicus TaxID=857417 RepID=A0A7L9J137_9MICO|nr:MULTISPECIES: metalloregulator ArsR/SmtB family transcription factor [Micrococcales]QCP05684.1 helix-turn-helix transcriptional regulator [Brevibacterium sp. CS2]QOK23109.1 helix-turn-helix transcriptional regulator [Janibacter indicus]
MTNSADTGQPLGANAAASNGGDQSVEAVLAALADPTRRQLLSALVDIGQASATLLAGRLPVSRQAVVKHLHVLETAGLVERVRAGREVLYFARPDPLDASARWLADLSATWDTRLKSLKRAAETTADD